MNKRHVLVLATFTFNKLSIVFLVWQLILCPKPLIKYHPPSWHDTCILDPPDPTCLSFDCWHCKCFEPSIGPLMLNETESAVRCSQSSGTLVHLMAVLPPSTLNGDLWLVTTLNEGSTICKPTKAHRVQSHKSFQYIWSCELKVRFVS